MRTSENMVEDFKKALAEIEVVINEIEGAEMTNSTVQLEDKQLKDLTDAIEEQENRLRVIMFGRSKEKAISKSKKVARQGIKSAKKGLNEIVNKISNSLNDEETEEN